MSKQTTQHPYEVSPEGAHRAFLTVITGTTHTYLPWHALKRMKYAEARSHLSMEFANESVEIAGSGLAALAELAAGARIKLIRQGESDEVSINSIRLVTDND